MKQTVAVFRIGRNVDGVPTFTHSQVIAVAKTIPVLQDGFTDWDAGSMWNGKMERSSVIECVGMGRLEALGIKLLLESRLKQIEVFTTLAEVEVIE